MGVLSGSLNAFGPTEEHNASFCSSPCCFYFLPKYPTLEIFRTRGICQSENYLGERETRSYKIHIPPAFPMHFHYFSKPQSQCQPCQTSLKHWAISFAISRAPSFSIAEAAQTNTETLWKTYVTGQPNAAWGGSPISTIGSKLDVKLKAAPSHRHTTIRLQWAVITRFQPDTPVIPLMKAELS